MTNRAASASAATETHDPTRDCDTGGQNESLQHANGDAFYMAPINFIYGPDELSMKVDGNPAHRRAFARQDAAPDSRPLAMPRRLPSSGTKQPRHLRARREAARHSGKSSVGYVAVTQGKLHLPARSPL